MAVTVVRTMGEADGSLSIATAEVPVGNKLAVGIVAGASGQNPTVADSDGANTYTQRVTAGDNDTVEFHTCDVSDAIEVADTITNNGVTPAWTSFVELSGMASGDPYDQNAGTSGSFVANHTVGPATPSQQDTIAVAIFKDQGTTAHAPGAGWTEFFESTASSEVAAGYYKRLMSTAACTCQTVNAAANYDAAMVILKGDQSGLPASLSAWGGAGTVSGTATSGAACAPTYPGSISAGNILLYAAGFRDNATTPTTPSGFTLFPGFPFTTSANTGRLWLYYKLATGSESGTETCGSQAVAINRSAQIYRLAGDYTGADLEDVVAGFAWTAFNATAAPDEDVATPEDWCVAYNLTFSNDNNTMTPGIGWTEANDVNTTPGTGASFTLNYCESAAAMTVGGVSHTMSAADPAGTLGFYVKSPPEGGAPIEVDLTNAAETDTAQAIDVDKAPTLTLAATTDTAQALKLPKLAPVAEADTAVAVDVDKAPTLVLAAETDTAQPLTFTKVINKTLTLAAETDTAQPLDVDKQVTLVLVGETDQAQTLSGPTTYNLTLAAETDSAQALDADKALGITLGSETDAAQALTAAKAATLTTSTETDTAQALDADKQVTIGVATETDTAVAVTYSQAGAYTIAAATEADAAQTLTFTKTIHVTIGVATETDTAQPVTGAHTRTITLATETSTAVALDKDKAVTLTLAATTDTARPVAFTKTIFQTVAPATEADTATTLLLTGGVAVLDFYDLPTVNSTRYDPGPLTDGRYDLPTPEQVMS